MLQNKRGGVFNVVREIPTQLCPMESGAGDELRAKDQRRKTIAAKVIENMNEGILKYPVGYAIKDALNYHAACSAVTGLEVAKDSISRVDNSGITEFKKFLSGLKKQLDIVPLTSTSDYADEADEGGEAENARCARATGRLE